MTSYDSTNYPIQAGDIVACLGQTRESKTICLGTLGWPFWPYLGVSHLGIIGEYRGKPYIFESTTWNEFKCEIRHKTIKGTQAHRIEPWIERYAGMIWHYPLITPLYRDEKTRLNKFLRDGCGEPYDTLGALRIGAGLSWLESRLGINQLASIFCSEWCAAAHSHIGIFNTDNVSRWSPNKFLRAERRQKILGRPRRLK